IFKNLECLKNIEPSYEQHDPPPETLYGRQHDSPIEPPYEQQRDFPPVPPYEQHDSPLEPPYEQQHDPPPEPQPISFLAQSTLITIKHALEIVSHINQSQCHDEISEKFKLILKKDGPGFGSLDLSMSPRDREGKIWMCYVCDYEKPIRTINGSFKVKECEVFQYIEATRS
ncbi:16161_t:CDS:2, partial [Dentiscutata erythropus]